jgi:hypothetical protein
MSHFKADGRFRQIDGVAKAARFLLFASVALNLVSIASSAFQYQLLDQFERGVYTDQDLAIADANSNDLRQQVIGYMQVILYLITAVIFLVWTYRCAWNARRLDPEVMQIRPGWAVGWYFIPIANLWMPDRAVGQIWTASSGSRNKGFIGWWWLFFILDNVVGQIVFRTSLTAETINSLKNVTIAFVVSDIVSTIGAILAVRVVTRITRVQSTHISSGPGAVEREAEIGLPGPGFDTPR